MKQFSIADSKVTVNPQTGEQSQDFSKNPLEIQRFDFAIKVQLEGYVEKKEEVVHGLKTIKSTWIGSKKIKATAYDS